MENLKIRLTIFFLTLSIFDKLRTNIEKKAIFENNGHDSDIRRQY